MLSFNLASFAQKKSTGNISGTVFQSENKALPYSTVELCVINSLNKCVVILSDKDGSFEFDSLVANYYSLKISSVGFASKKIDSIYLREERMDFNLNEIILSNKAITETEVIVYAERPLIENKDGKIIYNVGETAAANSSNVNELLQKTPLVTIDAEGKILLKGKEVKILIDDKPVELNAKQLQEMLESMPGSFIDKIEVMTNPPPQYANERGGVINIVSKKGKVGFTLRANVYYGTRGEVGTAFVSSYRKNKISTQFNIAVSENKYIGNGNYTRQNNYTDSSNYLHAASNYTNKSFKPTLRWNADYDFNKRNSVNLSVNFNANSGNNNSISEFANTNRELIAYKFNDRAIISDINNNTINISNSYLWKNKSNTGALKIANGFVYSNNKNERDFYQIFYGLNRFPLGIDSTQFQTNFNRSKNYALRINYDKSFDSGKYFFSSGVNFLSNNSYNDLDAQYLKKPANIILPQLGFDNEFYFLQKILQLRAALKYRISVNVFATAGIQVEHTQQGFNHISLANKFNKTYVSYLPFVLITKKWNNNYNLSLSYKKSLQRPGINETNPAVDIADPYNTRFGNPYLLPFYAHNFDASIGKIFKKFNYNASVGYNALLNLYAPIRTLQPDGKTFITYENISNRKEYEASIWGAYTFAKNSKISASAGYNYNVYSDFDKLILRYRDGGSFTSNINGSYIPKDIIQFGVGVTYNRFANPQGTVRSNVSMNFSAQRKFFKKMVIVTLNTVDPFTSQQNTTYTYGSNFILQNYSFTKTRNYKLNIAYNFIKKNKGKKKRSK
jgi:outer membrane receptor protein involved in Fe transport